MLTRTSERRGRFVGREPEPPVGHRVESIDAVEAQLRKLPKMHAAALRRIYVEDKTQSQVARELGCSQSRLSFLHREAIAMLNGTWGLDDEVASQAA